MNTGYTTKKELAAHYQKRSDDLSAHIAVMKKKNRMYIMLELLTFCLAVTAAVIYCTADFSRIALAAAAVMLGAYVLVRRADVSNSRRVEDMTRRRDVYADELRYMQGDFTRFGDGKAYVSPDHEFTFDIDVFGRDSLFNRINHTVTTGGSDMLASWLGSLLHGRAEVERRRQAIAELAGMEEWRTAFIAAGRGGQTGSDGRPESTDTMAVLRAVNSVAVTDIAPKAGSRTALVAAWAAIAVFIALIALAVAGAVPASVATVWGVVQMFAVIGLNAKAIRDISRAVEKLHAHMHTYLKLMRHICGARFDSDELNGLQSGLGRDGDGALASFGRLSEILNSLDRRGNFIGLVLFNMFALNDFFLVRKFLDWQRMYMDSIADWVECVSRMDALVSMATFRYNEPGAVEAVVEDNDSVIYEATELYHPFLGDKAVRNDFTIRDGEYYIITGANMAGKSTFLRSVGINYVLAMNGMPVFAGRMRVSPFRLFTSMRTSDDLSRGISYFNAELLRLKQLLDECRRPGRTLIILDEILKGTNSLDKLNGSRLFLRAVAKLSVTGIIATHDLELSKMEDEQPQRFHNWCFEIGLADDITYTYKITPGVARNQNATFLLNRLIDSIQQPDAC